LVALNPSARPVVLMLRTGMAADALATAVDVEPDLAVVGTAATMADGCRLAAELQEERVGVDCQHSRSRQPVHHAHRQRARPGAEVEHAWRRADELADQRDHHPKALLALGQVVALLSLPPSQPRCPVNDHLHRLCGSAARDRSQTMGRAELPEMGPTGASRKAPSPGNRLLIRRHTSAGSPTFRCCSNHSRTARMCLTRCQGLP